MELVKEVGAFAGFAAVAGLAVLAALYFSQARDLKRLREWAGRSPERAAEEQVAGQPVPGGVRTVPAQQGAARAPAAQPIRPGQPRAPGTAVPGKPATAQQPAPAQPGAVPATAKPGVVPVPAGRGAAAAPAQPGAPAQLGAPATPGVPARPGGPTPAATPARQQAGAVAPATRPGGAPAQQTRVIPRTAAEAARRRAEERSAAPRFNPRYALAAVAGVALIAIVLIVAGGSIFGDDEPAPTSNAEQRNGGGGGDDGANSTPAVDPSQINVAVLNGTTVEGLARTIGDEVQAAGFGLGNVTNASDQGERAESAVVYAPDHKADARAVARKLNISQIEPADPESQALAGDATVIVIVGLDQTQ